MKKLKLFLTSIVAMFVAVLGVHAAGITGGGASDWHNRTWESDVTTSDDGVVTIKLKDNLRVASDAGLEVADGENVILDLNGKTLTNYCASNESPSGCTAGSATIEVRKGGTLTITDSSNGEGTITQKAGTKDIVVIDNKGTLNIEKGIIKGLAGVTTGQTPISVILNQGTMNMSGGTVISNDAELSAGIHNLANGILNITGDAKIETGSRLSWGVLNYGKTTITGGTFTQKYQYSVIQNSGDMTIENGTFNSDVEDAYALITNENVANSAKTGNASLTINGGDFKGNVVLSYGTSKKGEAVINKGNFDTQQDISGFIALGSELDEEGNVVKKELHNIEVKENENAKIELDKYSTFEGDIVNITITPKEGYKLDKLTILDKDGKEVKFVSADGGVKFTMPASDVTISATFKKVETPVVNPEKTEEENPKTGDNILMYLGLGLASVAVVGLSVKKLRKSN